ncbi:hypothetical protein [Streptomyces sp. NPDC020681]|uniref:hypothetical protein n=1 Tax=Streptomyces sp. NPDC020681 TaxID=3365083 RepID=UPI0037A6E4DC
MPESYGIAALVGPVPDDHYKTLALRFDPSVAQDDAEVVIDTTDAKDVADFRFYEDCSVSGSGATCPVSLNFHESSTLAPTDFLIELRPKEGIAPGSSAVIRYTVRAGKAIVSPASHLQTRLNVIAEGALFHAPMPATVKVSPGGTYALPVEVRNIGTRAKGGVAAKRGTRTTGRSGVALSVELKAMTGGEGLELLGGNYTNCRYGQEQKAGSGRLEYSSAYCEFDTPMEPGKAYGLSAPLKVRAVAEHAKSEVHVGLKEVWDSQERSGYEERRGTGGVLRLVSRPATGSIRSLVNLQDGSGQSIKVDIKSPSVTGEPDVAAVGATVRGADVGKPFDVKVGIRNAGPAPTYEGRVERLTVQIPEGVDVLLADKRCRREMTNEIVLYECENDGRLLRPGHSLFFGFRMRVARPIAEASASVHRYGFDEGNGNDANDRSPLTIFTGTSPPVSRHGA